MSLKLQEFCCISLKKRERSIDVKLGKTKVDIYRVSVNLAFFFCNSELEQSLPIMAMSPVLQQRNRPSLGLAFIRGEHLFAFFLNGVDAC